MYIFLLPPSLVSHLIRETRNYALRGLFQPRRKKERGTVARVSDLGLKGPHEAVKVFTDQEKDGDVNVWQIL